MDEYKQKYQHIERLGSEEVEGILDGVCYIFPKIDGTTGVMWTEGGIVQCGSRKRQLTLDNDNRGFLAWARKQSSIAEFFALHPEAILYGEWLVPHNIKQYSLDSWDNFYIFDAKLDGIEYAHWEAYGYLLALHGFKVIPYSDKIIVTGSMNEEAREATTERINQHVEANHYLLPDDVVGEGVVIKNYPYRNKYGRQTWAKVVRQEFKESTRRKPRASVDGLERTLAEYYITDALTTKILEKQEAGIEKHEVIGRLMNEVFRDFVVEELHDSIKKHKYPAINFHVLRKEIQNRVRVVRKELF